MDNKHTNITMMIGTQFDEVIFYMNAFFMMNYSGLTPGRTLRFWTYNFYRMNNYKVT